MDLKLVVLTLFALLSLTQVIGFFLRRRFPLPTHLNYLWALSLVLCAAAWRSVSVAVWILALLAFRALREYFSLLEIRPADRLAILASYLAIPFMTWLVAVEWYGMFIISIPVYVFLVIPFLVALGGESRGAVLSIGAIDFGLFLLVYCLGHIAYLLHYSLALTLLLVLAVAICDGIRILLGDRGGRPLRLIVSALLCLALFWLSRDHAAHPGGPNLPDIHALVLGLLIPILVMIGDFTLGTMEEDLGIDAQHLSPGRGQVFDGMKTWLFTAPVVFHYLRWFLRWGDFS